MTAFIYHITRRDSWEAAKKDGLYRADSLESQGFIHCSKADQLMRVANTFYAKENDLVILAIDPASLTSEVRWEPGTDKADEMFPHIYGAIEMNAVEKVFDLKHGADGSYLLPPGVA